MGWQCLQAFSSFVHYPQNKHSLKKRREFNIRAMMTSKSACWMLVLLLVVSFASCRPRIPSGILSESQMEDILYDYHLAQGAAEQENDADVEKKRYLYVQAVFSKHGVTEAEFDSSMVWYASHSSRLQKVYERLSERYNNELSSLGVGLSESELISNLSENGDTTDIWSGNRILVLQNDYLHSLSILNMKADSTFLPGDNYALHFHASFLGNGSMAYVFLSVFYKDGTSKAEMRQLRGSYDYKVALPDDIVFNNRETDRIQITFYFAPEEEGDSRAFMCVENPILARFHRKDRDKPTSEETLQSDSAALVVDSVATDSMLHPNDLKPVKIENEREDFNLDREKAVRRPMRQNNHARRSLK